MLVAIALANKMARGLWAMMTKNEEYGGAGDGGVKLQPTAIGRLVV